MGADDGSAEPRYLKTFLLSVAALLGAFLALPAAAYFNRSDVEDLYRNRPVVMPIAFCGVILSLVILFLVLEFRSQHVRWEKGARSLSIVVLGISAASLLSVSSWGRQTIARPQVDIRANRSDGQWSLDLTVSSRGYRDSEGLAFAVFGHERDIGADADADLLYATWLAPEGGRIERSLAVPFEGSLYKDVIALAVPIEDRQEMSEWFRTHRDPQSAAVAPGACALRADSDNPAEQWGCAQLALPDTSIVPMISARWIGDDPSHVSFALHAEGQHASHVVRLEVFARAADGRQWQAFRGLFVPDATGALEESIDLEIPDDAIAMCALSFGHGVATPDIVSWDACTTADDAGAATLSVVRPGVDP